MAPEKSSAKKLAPRNVSILSYFSPHTTKESTSPSKSSSENQKTKDCNKNSNNNSVSRRAKRKFSENIKLSSTISKKTLNVEPIIISSDENEDFENIRVSVKNGKKRKSSTADHRVKRRSRRLREKADNNADEKRIKSEVETERFSIKYAKVAKEQAAGKTDVEEIDVEIIGACEKQTKNSEEIVEHLSSKKSEDCLEYRNEIPCSSRSSFGNSQDEHTSSGKVENCKNSGFKRDSNDKEKSELQTNTEINCTSRNSISGDKTELKNMQVHDFFKPKVKTDRKESRLKVNSSKKTEKSPTKSSQTPGTSQSDKPETDNNKLSDENSSESTDENKQEKIAYYLLNFHHVLDTVLGNEDDRSLFEGTEDIMWIEKFKQLPLTAQKLYVRLYHRKLAWLRLEQVSYLDIAKKIQLVLSRLADEGFLLSFTEENNETLPLSEVLKLLPAACLRELAKSYHISVNGRQKNQISAELEEMCNKQRSLMGGFFSKKSEKGAQRKGGLKHAVMRRACKLLGPCYKVAQYPRTVFNRVLLVFDVTRGIDDETDCSLTGSQNAQGQGRHLQLSAILMAGMKRVAYPAYEIERPTPIFCTRSDILHYETAFQFQNDVMNCIEAGQWKEAAVLCNAANKIRIDLEANDQESCEHSKNLPIFLRCFTAQWTYARLRSLEVEILQRLKNYKKAVEILRELLDQKHYCTNRRGHWWERLALNVDKHLKDAERSLDVIHESLNDTDVRVGHKLALAQRVNKILSSRAASKSPVLQNTYQTKLQPMIERLEIEEAPVVEITGRQLPVEMQTAKSRFVTTESDDITSESTLLCSVEELALSHYRGLGYDLGIHGEGGTFSTLFCLALWDIIFMRGVPDVFRTSYQTHPLDYHTDEFYLRRRDAIEKRLRLIEEMKVEDSPKRKEAEEHFEKENDENELENLSALDLMLLTWDTEYGKACAGMNWERFNSFEEAKGFMLCIGGKVLSGILRRLAKDLRHTRSGLPDLVVWNPVEMKYKMVEVKGPGDRLFNNQKLWLDELMKLGANVEVCRVIAIGGKKLSRE